MKSPGAIAVAALLGTAPFALAEDTAKPMKMDEPMHGEMKKESMKKGDVKKAADRKKRERKPSTEKEATGAAKK
jgi:pentapeptide MXKDX repeat protein